MKKIAKYKKEHEMKKITALIFALILTLGLVGCNGKTVNIDFPFEVEDVESVEMYHYDGVPASAEKKVVVAESDIKTLYDMFKGLSLKDKTAEETAGADVTSFRFNLSDGTSYDLIYACQSIYASGRWDMNRMDIHPRRYLMCWTRLTRLQKTVNRVQVLKLQPVQMK